MVRIAVIYSLLILGIAAGCRQRPEPVLRRPVSTTQGAISTPDPEVRMQYSWHSSPDSLYLHLLFYDVSRLMELQRTADKLTIHITNENKTTLYRDTLQITKPAVPDSGEEIWVEVALPASLATGNNTAQLRLWQKFAGEATMYSVFNVQLQSLMLEKTGVLTSIKNDRPIIYNYITTSDSLVLQNPDSIENMTVYYFTQEFAPAIPPMSQRNVAQAKTISPTDSVMFAPGDTVTFNREGLYLLWAGTSYPTGLLVEPWHFPKITMAKEMLQPLIYLTTSAEREKLFNAVDPKKAVDDFWIGVAGERHLARELIRTYYGRVEHANKLYTSHKAGWTTDRGMIYLIYGPPSDISKVGNTETWIYRESDLQPYTKFVFTKKQNNFTENHYELIRRREYEEGWYSAVAKWRAGITDM